ncbi:MAG: NAD(P)/FAD-dependent oxidoreductase [Clostridia bacterium]|nr:NAD(P)/FAD-dependent oxidoreductase [Clostridia bacterium]
MSDKNYDIIVIGAGCGGLSAAVCAAKEGKKVLLLERHNAPGGFVSSFVRGRFEFDISLQQLCGFSQDAEHGELRQLFDKLNITNKIEWVKIPEAYRLISKSADGSEIDAIMPYGIEEYIDAMEYYVPGSKKSMKKLFELADEIEKGFNFIAETNGSTTLKEKRRFNKENENFVRTAPYSVNEVLNALEVPLKAREIFNAHWMHFGIDCDRMSFVHYANTINFLIKYGSSIPKNRSNAITMALLGEFEDNGGEARFNSHVMRILFNDGKASGVILKSGEKIECNHIICTCSPTTAYAKMMKKSDIPVTAVKRTNARNYGARGACVYIGLNRSPEELGIEDYLVYITDSADTASQYTLMKLIDTNNAIKAICLNIANPDCSPSGTTILCLSTFYTDNCWANIPPEGYFDEKDLLAARLIAAYEQKTGVTIHNNIEELEVATPVTFARYTGTPQGTVYGYLGDDWDSLLPRVMTEATDCDTKGLRFCGGWGAQLTGVDAAVVTGRNAAFATIADIDEERSINNE